MKTTNYKKGDVVLLNDGGRDARFEYLGEAPVAGIMTNAYKPLDGKTEYATIKDTAAEFARRIEAGDGFALNILANPKLFVIGTADDLGKFAGDPSPASV